MEPGEAWSQPCELQLASYWTHEEQPDTGLPLEYTSIDIFGDCSLQAYVPESSGGQQLPDECYYYSSSSSLLHNDSSSSGAEVILYGQNSQVTEEIPSKHHQVVDSQNEETRISNDSRAAPVFKEVSHAFKVDIDNMEYKMHRYPACLRGLDEAYTVPRIVAIGPYHHHHPHLKQAEMVKHMAAIRCVEESGHLLEDVFGAVALAADKVRGLYDKDVMAGIGCEDFQHMMFFDACFLVQYMAMRSGEDIDMDQSLLGFLSPKRIDIQHDVTLLENQLPWKVVETLMWFRPVTYLPLYIITFMSFLQIQGHEDSSSDKENRGRYRFDNNDPSPPPHLLGLLWRYIIGKSDDDTTNMGPRNIAFSTSAIELAKIGITLKAKNTTELIRMGVEENALCAQLSVAPLFLDRDRASYLLNMAALELCTVKSFGEAEVEKSAVCSYLLLLAMLVYKEEDVDELRAKGILEGGGGLTNKEALRFFSKLQGLRLGRRYVHVMQQVQSYKNKNPVPTNLVACFYNNWASICQFVSILVIIATIIGPIVSVLPHK